MNQDSNPASGQNLLDRLQNVQDIRNNAQQEAYSTLNQRITFVDESGNQVGDARYLQRAPGKNANYDIRNPNIITSGSTDTIIGGRLHDQAFSYDYNPISGQLTFKAPQAVADAPQWQGFVNGVNTTLRNQPLQQAINYLDTDEFNKAYTNAIANATTYVTQRATLTEALNQDVTQQDVDYFGASSTLTDGEGKVRDGAYLYVPVTQPDGMIVYQRMPASEALKVKNIANIVPGFIRNSKEYIDSTAGEYAATGAGIGNIAGQAIGGVAGGVAGGVSSGGVAAVGGASLGRAVGGNVGSTLGAVAGYLIGDEDGHMDSRFSEVLNLVNEKGDTSIMDLSQDEKAEVYAMVAEANSRLQSWADKGIELSPEMKQYYANMAGLQYSLQELGFNKMSGVTTTKNAIENFGRQTLNSLSGGGTTLLSAVAGLQTAIGEGDWSGFGRGYSELSTNLATTGLDTYSSPAEQLFAPRSKEGVIGDRGWLGVGVDFVLGLALDPGGKAFGAVDDLVAKNVVGKTTGTFLKVIPSVVDDGGISLLASGIGAANRAIRNAASNRASQAAARQTANAAGAAGNAVAKDIARQVANAAETQVDDGLDVAVNKVANAVSDAGSDEVKQTIRNVANASAEAGEEGLEEAAEQAGKRLSLDDLKRVGGEMLTNGRQITAGVANVLGQAVNAAVDDIAKVVTAAYDGLSRLGGTDRLRQLLGGFGTDTSKMSTEQIKQAYRNAVAGGMVRNAIFQVAKQMPMNAVIALGNTAIEQATSQAQGQKFDRQDFWNSLLSNFGTTMLMSAAPAGLRAGSSVLDALTNGGVAKIRDKANQFATKISAAAGTFLRQAPIVKNIREKMQQFAKPDARSLHNLRYLNNLARGKGLIRYDEWVANIDKLSEAQVSTQAMGTASRLGAKDLFAADNRVMNMMGALKVSGKPKRGDAYTTARKLLNDFIIYDDMAYRLSPDAKATADLTKTDLETRANNRAEYLKRRDEALEQMEKLVEDNGGDVNEFRTALYGSRLDTDVDTTQGPVRAAANDLSFRGRIRTFYDARSQLMADNGITSQSSLDALRTNPAYAGTYIRLAYLEGKSVDEIAENVAQFYVVTNKPKTSAIVQSVKNELGLDDSRELAGVTELAVRSIYDVSDAILANDRNKIAVKLSDVLGDADMSFCKLSGDPDIIDQGEAAIQSYKDFQANAQATFDEQIAYDPNVDKRRRTDRDSANLNEYHQKLTNTDYIQQQATEAGVTPEAMARSYMAATEQQMVDSYRKLERARFGNEKGDKLARQYKKKLDAWLSGEDLSQRDVRQRRELKAEMAKQRNVMARLGDAELERIGNSIKATPVQQAMARQELARRRSVNHGTRQVSVPVAKEGDTTQYLDKLAKEKFEADAQNRGQTDRQLGRTQLPESSDTQVSIADAPRQQRTQSTQMLRPAEELGQQTDALGFAYTEAEVPVSGLIAGRSREFQPRVTASGEGTRRSVRERGYQEGMVDQPLIVWKDGDTYKVLGGHSRTMGLEDRAKAGLDNPENVRARVYTGITEAQAKQISRRANQGGQYESDLDMAKSIAESKRAGEEPQVQKNNMARYTTYDDYAFAWDAIEHDTVMQQVVNSSETFNTKSFIAGAKKARKLGLTPQEYMRTVKSLYANDRLTATNVDIVTRQVTTRRKNKAAKEAQGMLFDDDLGVAVDSLDILNEHAALSRQLKSQQNALKKVTKIGGMSESFVNEANSAIDTIKAKMDGIDNELIRRYNARQQARNVADGKATARLSDDGRSIEITTRGTEDNEEPETYLVSTDQANLFGGTIADDVAMRSFNGTPQDFVDQTAEATKDQLETQVDSNQGSLFAEQDVPQPSRQETTEQEAEPETAEPATAKEWYDAFVREHDAPPTIDDYKARIQDEMDGTAPAALTNVMDLTMYHQIRMAQDQRGIVLDNYVQQHAKALHLGKSYDMATVKKTMSYVPENAIKLAENNVKAPTLAQCKSAALYTGQLGSKELSPDVIRGLEAIAEKQTVSSQRQAMNSFMADDSVADVNGVFYSKLSDENKKRFMDSLEARTKDAVASVNGRFVVPDNLTGQDRAAFLGKQLQRARLVQEIQTNPQKYSKQEFSLARDDDGNPIPGSGKYLTSPERLVIRSKPTDRFDTFNKFNQGIYKTLDQRNSHFNPTDEVYIGTGQVLAANDSEALGKIVRSMKRTFTDPATRQQISTFESRLNNLTGNSLDDLPLVQELLNSVYGVDAVRFTGKQGDTVLVLDGSSAKNGGIWEEKTTFDQIDAQTLHDYDTTADLWKDNVKSKQSDTKARINAEKANIKEGAKKPNFAIYRGGKRYTYEITNPVVAQAFQTVSMSTTKTTMDVLTRFGQRTARGFRSGTTGPLNPAYIFSNYVRDLQTASITAGIDTVLPKYADDLYTSIFEAAGVPTADAEDIARRLRDGYGNSSYSMSAQGILRHSPAQQRKILYREMKKATGSKKGVRRVASFDDLVTLMEKPSDWIEQNRRGRVAASYYNRYIREHLPDYLADGSDAARKQLVDNAVNYAIFAGRNATTDFSYRTQYASDFLSLIPYSRTALSSARSFGRMFLSDPIGMTTRILTYCVGPYIANLISNVSDDDKAATYAEIPEWERAANWIVVTGDGSYISAPIPQELEIFVSPARTLVENANDIKNSGALAALGGGLSNYSPIDFSGFFERDINGDLDWVKAAGRMANSLLPQAVSPAVETILNRDLYTSSPLHPTTEDLVRQGAKLNKDGTVDMSAMTYASRNSQTLGEIADFIGIPQGDVYNLVTGYTGTFGRYLINAVDNLRGAPSGSVGGQAPTDYAAQTFFNTNPTGASSAWNQGLSDLYDRKDNLIEVMDSQNYSDDEKDEYIRDYVDSVKRFCDAYSEYYAISGGMSDRQRNQVVGLLNFYKGTGSLDSTSDALTDAGYDEYNAALQRAVDIGVMPSGGLQSDLYGTMNDEGEVTYNTPAMRAFQNRVFGTPEQATREMTAVLDDDSNGGTMKELKSAVYDALDPYYERIAAGEQLTDEEYDEMDAIRKSYMDEFYRRIDPIIEQYGATILNNDDIIEALNNYTITTSDDWQESIPQYSKKGKEYHRYISSKLFPNATADVQQILLEHYGMGGRDTSNLRSDQRATELINALRQATAAGEMGKAQDYQRILFTGIQNGSFYVSDKDMSQLQI